MTLSRDTIKDYPTSPGVYIMHAQDESVLYVGKARNLRQRLANYFTTQDNRPQIRFLMARVCRITYLVTDTEQEALLLENTLIKKHKPRYNLNLKDDKTYVSLRIDLQAPYPRLTIVRKRLSDGARYFGPYASPSAAREVTTQIQQIFKLIRHPWKYCSQRRRPCLYFEIGQCSAPCHQHINQADYIQSARDAAAFLSGDRSSLLQQFTQRMRIASESMHYEEAARWRDIIRAINQTLEPQKVVQEKGTMDFIGMASDDVRHIVTVLQVRSGTVCGSIQLVATGCLDAPFALQSFITQYYTVDHELPPEVYIPFPLDDLDELAELLKTTHGKTVRIRESARGKKKELLDMAYRNAYAALQEHQQNQQGTQASLTELHERLALPTPPRLIECYDISTLQGTLAVGSGVAFVDGKPERSRYRRYKIRNVSGQNDFAMLQEVLTRRFSQEHITQWGVPDLLVIDGGIGQLAAVQAALAEIPSAASVPIAALAKSRTKRDPHGTEIKKSEERVFLPGRRNPLRFSRSSKALLLLAEIRDEAHRFAVGYHRVLRSKALTTSLLRDIPGVGEKTEKMLLTKYQSIATLKKLSLEQLLATSGLNRDKAILIHSFLLETSP